MRSLTQDPLPDAVQRSQRHWMADGIPEIVLGLLWFVWGSAVLLPFFFSKQVPARITAVLLMLTMAGFGLFAKPLIHGWKERVSFPRTGYIELRRPSRRVRIVVVVAAGVIAFAVALLASTGHRTGREWMPIGLGLLFAASILYWAWKMRSVRLAVFSGIIAAVAIAASIFHLRQDLSYGLTLITAGAACLADGMLIYRAYLHAHPLPAGEQQ